MKRQFTKGEEPRGMLQWTLSAENIEEVRDFMVWVLVQRCVVVEIISKLEMYHVWTSRMARPERGEVVHLFTRENHPAAATARPDGLSWSIADHHWSLFLWPDNPVRLYWNAGQLTIKHNAPAGHPLVWIFAPEQGAS